MKLTGKAVLVVGGAILIPSLGTSAIEGVAAKMNGYVVTECSTDQVKVEVPEKKFFDFLQEEGPTLGDVNLSIVPELSPKKLAELNDMEIGDRFPSAIGGQICVTVGKQVAKTVSATVESSAVTAAQAVGDDLPKVSKGIQAEMRQAAIRAGFSTSEANTLAAIMMAESGGNPKARCYNLNGTCSGTPSNNSSVDRGYLQFNSIHKHISDSCAEDVQCSANAAYQLYKNRGSFGDWVAYNKGLFKRFM